MRFTHKKRGAGGVWPIQKIVDRRDEPDGRRLYRIRWRFYDEKSDTWESIDALQTCLDVVHRYDEMRDQAEREGRWPPPPGSELSDHSPSTSRRSRPARSNSAMSSTPSRHGSVGGGASHSREQTPRDDVSEDVIDTKHPLPTKKQLAPDDAPPLDPHPPVLTTPLADMEQGIKSARGGRWVKLKKSSEEPRLGNTASAAKMDEEVKIDEPPAMRGEDKKEEVADAGEKTATKVEDDQEQESNREKVDEQLPSEDQNEDNKHLDYIPAVSPDEGSPELSTEVVDKNNCAVNASVEEEATPMEEEATPREKEATPMEDEATPMDTIGHEPAEAAGEAVDEKVATEASPPEECPPVAQSTTTSQPEKKKTKKKKSTPKKNTLQKSESTAESDKKLRGGVGDDSSAAEPSSSSFAETPSTSAAPRQNGREAKKTEADDKTQSSQLHEPPFAWDDYLKEAGAVPAPADAFYQPHDVPENLFEYDKFLLAPDDKSVYNPTQGCVAQVKGVHGPLVGIWLLGTDPRDVLWYMCDDQKLKPIVDLEAQKGQIVAPVMYRESLNNMHRKIAKAIFPNEGINLRQPPDSFRPIDSSRFRPRSNKFESGMKCEAFDPAEYTGFLYPCTIVVPEKEKDKEKEKAHDKKHVFIHFDGFSDGYNKKFSFDDRCIFPCGFATRAGLQIMPPSSSSSNTQPKYKQHKSTANSQQKTTTVTPLSVQETELQPASSSSTSPPLASTSLRKTTQAMLEMASSSSAGYGEKFSVPFRGAKPASSASSSSSSADKLAQVPKESTQRRRTVESSASVAQPSPPAKKARPFTPVSTPAAHSSPLPSRSAADSLSNERSRGRQLNLSLQMSEGVVFEPHPNAPAELMTVYVHDTCTAGPYLNPKKLSKLPSQYGPAQHIHLYREIMQQIVNCAFNQFSVAKMIDRPLPDPSNQILNVTACIPDGSVEVRYLQFVFTPTQADRSIHRLLKKLSACENLFTMVPGNCRHCAHRVNDSLHPRFIHSSSYATESVATNEQKCSLPRPNRVVSLSEVRELSYAQVCSFLISLGLPETYASQLFQEQVDGRALLRINDTRLISTAKLPNEALDFVRHMLDQAIP